MRIFFALWSLVLVPAQLLAQSGVHRELYFNLSRDGFSLAQLTNHPNFLAGRANQTNILSNLQTEADRGNDYGQRLRTYLIPPATGGYTFWIASDETSNLLLSTDEKPGNKRLIAWVDPRSQSVIYSTHFGQQSAPVALEAGRRYYLEVIHHEANLIDHLSVQWRLPAGTTENPIPGSRLAYEIPPLIITNLTDATVEEGRPAVFSPQVANFLPQSYRWQRNGADVPGATNRSYAINVTSLADDGAMFRAFITNRFGATNSAEAKLTVLRDTNAPSVTEVLNVNTTEVFVRFSEPVDASTALTLQNYTLSGAPVQSAAFGPDEHTIVLATSPLNDEATYTLSISNVFDRASASNRLADTRISFVARQFQSQSIGLGLPTGSVILAGSGVSIAGSGSDIGGRADQFQFGYQSVVGDFDFRARVEKLDFIDLWSKAGMMARETFEPNSRFAAVFASPTLAGAFFEHRTNTAGFAASSGSFPASFPSMWIRLQRAGNIFKGFASQDGNNWSLLGSVSNAMANRIYFGFAVSSHNTNQIATAQFRDFAPTSGGNAMATLRTEPLGPATRKTGLVISEIMYHPSDVLLGTNKAELEFVELFNSNPFYEDISGYRLSGDIDFTFPAGTFLQGGSFLVVARNPADVQAFYGIAGVLGPFTNNLPNDTGRVRLRNNNDFVLLEVNYFSRHPWPIAANGAGHSLVLARPSYGGNQVQAWAASDSIGGSPGRIEPVSAEPLRPLMINEFLAHTDEPLLDFIELYNHSNQAIDLGGALLTDNPATNKFRIASPTIIPARGFVSFNQDVLGFSLSSAGERILLVNSNQTRVIDAIGFGPQANGVSFGRFPDGVPAFSELSLPTPATANAPVLSADIVINEIMYHPISEESDDEYVELFNKGAGPVDLSGWRFADGIDFTMPSNTVIGSRQHLVIAKNKTNLWARYPQLSSTNTVGDYDGQLGNDGERIALARPEFAVNADNPFNVTTNVIYVVVDEVDYRDGGRWGNWSDGGGSSLELIDPRSDNRLAPNWADSDETTKAPWTTIEHTGLLDNGGDTADSLHVIMLEEGECLLDDVEVFPAGSPNRIANATFETGLTGWTMRGDHERSSLENSGFNSSRSLHVRASARGDIGPNKIRVPFTTALSAGQTATIRAKVRWLRGWPEILLRIRGSYLEATDRMIIPPNLGTPGAPNSRIANAGPAITDVTHLPAVPAANEPVQVLARFSDPDGLSSLFVKYRVDPATNFTTVPMADQGTDGDALAGDGIFSATIPGQPADRMVGFIVEASDAGTISATSRFPALRDDNGPTRECLVHFGSPTPASSFGTYRFWISQQSITKWSQREALSNERIPGTFVYGNHRVIYDSGGRYSGSAAHQDMGAPDYSPAGTPNNYTFDMPKDDLLLGTDNFNKIHGAGNNHHDDNTLQREVTAYWMAQRLGLPANYKRFVGMFINGARRGSLMEDTQVPNGEVVESIFPDDAEGDLYKISVWYEYGLTGQALSFTGVSEGYLNNYTTTGGAKKRARYRWNWQGRALHGTANNYTNLYALIDAANTPAGPAFVQNMEAIADMENWMRTFALEHAVGNWDSFGYRNEQNMFAYKPERSRWSLLIWDINIIFGGGTRGPPIAPNGDLFEIDPADLPMPKIYNTPVYRRAYWRALREIAEGLLLNANADPLMDARLAAFAASGVNVTPPDTIKAWINQRRSYIFSELAKVDTTNFNLTTPASFSTTTNLISVSGTAPVRVLQIEVNGVAYPVTWTTITNWTLRVPLSQASNELTIVGLDGNSRPVAGAAKHLSVLYTGPLSNAWDHLVINEWLAGNTTNLADIADGHFEDWFELYNGGGNAVNLAGYYLTDDPANGMKFRIPDGYVIPAGGFLLAWADEETGQNSSNRIDLHVNFRLAAAGGESISLYSPEGSLIDRVTLGPQTDDISEGRFADGAGTFYFMRTPTPRRSNTLGAGDSPRPRVTHIHVVTTGGISFSVETVPGKTYRVEFKTNLNDELWFPLGGNRVAVSASLIITDSVVTNVQRFYRVIVLD